VALRERHLSSAQDQLLPNEQIRWVYENAFLYCGRRYDGICLAIFTSKDPQVFDQELIERLIVEFRALGNETPK